MDSNQKEKLLKAKKENAEKKFNNPENPISLITDFITVTEETRDDKGLYMENTKERYLNAKERVAEDKFNNPENPIQIS